MTSGRYLTWSFEPDTLGFHAFRVAGKGDSKGAVAPLVFCGCTNGIHYFLTAPLYSSLTCVLVLSPCNITSLSLSIVYCYCTVPSPSIHSNSTIDNDLICYMEKEPSIISIC